MNRRKTGSFAIQLIGWVSGLWVMATAVFAQTCPLCKTVLTNSPQGRSMAAGFNHGILFLLAMPYLLAGGIGFFIAPMLKKNDHNSK